MSDPTPPPAALTQAAMEAQTPNGRTTGNAIAEAERLLEETFELLQPERQPNDGWFLTRLTKIREALADRPITEAAARRAPAPTAPAPAATLTAEEAWVPVGVRLPEVPEGETWSPLILIRGKWGDEPKLSSYCRQSGDWAGASPWRVTHWLPIPPLAGAAPDAGTERTKS